MNHGLLSSFMSVEPCKNKPHEKRSYKVGRTSNAKVVVVAAATVAAV
jgi:hypothetical protein